MQTSLPSHDVVLVGLGHTNAHVLRMWKMSPTADARLTCISDFPVATYSGMLPGTLAGLYPPDRMTIDLVRLCAAAGARFLQAEVTGLDLAGRQLLLNDRPAVRFDVLSIGIGSIPKGIEHQAAPVVPIKPMQTFLDRFDRRLDCLARSSENRRLRIVVVGGGAGGVEVAFCLPRHIERRCPGLRFDLSIVDGADDILPGAAPGAIRLARRELERRGVGLLLRKGVSSVGDGRLTLADGTTHEADLVIWSTGAAAPPLLAKLGLPVDEQGFLLTRPSLQTVADAPVFVVGDSASCPEQPRPKAGVYAVRQGPILWENIQRRLRGQTLIEYDAQQGFLSLMATGDGRAILSYKGLAAHGRWCWKVKDFIDSRFIDKYQDYRPRMMEPAQAQPNVADASAVVPRCAGCGSKVGASVLAKVLARLDVPVSEHVLVGLEAPDDAAVVRTSDGKPMVATIDFFPAFLDDPYFVGRVAALNAMSDVFALGGRPLAALAMVTIPPGSMPQQEQLLYELLSGGLRELAAAGATLAGGHTTEGEQLTVGFTMLAETRSAPRLKSGLRPGDRLVLTKPLGSGVLLAAHMRALCRASWLEPLTAALLASNQRAAEVAGELDVGGMTDITGFGLAGHLLEMLRASDAAAKVDLATVPLLPGMADLLADGIESTLAPANRAAEDEIDCDENCKKSPEYAALFDPQTSGGLLLGLRPERVDDYLARMTGHATCTVIGEVVGRRSSVPRLSCYRSPKT